MGPINYHILLMSWEHLLQLSLNIWHCKNKPRKFLQHLYIATQKHFMFIKAIQIKLDGKFQNLK